MVHSTFLTSYTKRKTKHHAMNVHGEWMYRATHSYPRQQIDITDQPHAPLSGGEVPHHPTRYTAHIHNKNWNNFWGNASNKRKCSELWLVPDRTPCRRPFKQLQILPSPCQYTFSLIHLPASDEEYFRTNSSLCGINTRNKHHLPRKNANHSSFHKRTFSVGIRIFSSLSHSVTQVLTMKRNKLKSH
jgi:hypothetical protein